MSKKVIFQAEQVFFQTEFNLPETKIHRTAAGFTLNLQNSVYCHTKLISIVAYSNSPRHKGKYKGYFSPFLYLLYAMPNLEHNNMYVK